MKAYNIRVYGLVQRVGYRRHILYNAQRLKIYGYVKNNPDGSVSIFAQGDEDKVNRFIDIISKPQEPIIIENIEKREVEEQDVNIFKIISGDLIEELQEGFGAMESMFFNYWQEFRGFANRTDENFAELKNEVRSVKDEVKLTRDEIKEFREESRANFNELKNEVRSVKDEIREFRDESLGSSKILRDEIKGFRNETRESFILLNTKYGEISDKLTMILEQISKDREEADKRWKELNKDLKKSIDTLVELVRSKI